MCGNEKIRYSNLIIENKGTFENKRSCDMNAYGVYGKTVQKTLFEGDEKKIYSYLSQYFKRC